VVLTAAVVVSDTLTSTATSLQDLSEELLYTALPLGTASQSMLESEISALTSSATSLQDPSEELDLTAGPTGTSSQTLAELFADVLTSTGAESDSILEITNDVDALVVVFASLQSLVEAPDVELLGIIGAAEFDVIVDAVGESPTSGSALTAQLDEAAAELLTTAALGAAFLDAGDGETAANIGNHIGAADDATGDSPVTQGIASVSMDEAILAPFDVLDEVQRSDQEIDEEIVTPTPPAPPVSDIPGPSGDVRIVAPVTYRAAKEEAPSIVEEVLVAVATSAWTCSETEAETILSPSRSWQHVEGWYTQPPARLPVREAMREVRAPTELVASAAAPPPEISRKRRDEEALLLLGVF
jgi:hypothetical protein